MFPAKGKQIAINISGNSTYRKVGDRWHAHFPALDVHAQADTQEDLRTALFDAIGRCLKDADESVQERWRLFCQKNLIEIDLSPEELQAQRQQRNLAARFAGSGLRAITEESFDGILASSRMTLVDFWAPWCEPCTQLSPILQELATRHAEKLDVYALDIDAHAAAVERFRIHGVPTLIVFQGGTETLRIHGLRTLEQLERELFGAARNP